MNAEELRDLIDRLAQDIDFEYNGKIGSICAFSHSEISLSYDGIEVTVNSIDAAMEEPFIDGLSLEEICEELNI